MERRNLIYGILDIRDPERIRYVGKTVTNLSNRMRNHWTYARNSARPTRIQGWLRSRIDNPEVVEIRELCEADDENELNELEVFWISNLRSAGQADLNLTDGGDGGRGSVHSPESRTALSEKYRASGGPSAKLNWATVHEIRARRQALYQEATVLAADYGVTRTAIDRILKNQLWFDPTFNPESIASRPAGSHHRTKLTMDEVRELRNLRLSEWVSSRSLADKFRMSESAIQHLLENKTYRDPEYDPARLAKRGQTDFTAPNKGRRQLSALEARDIKARALKGEPVSQIAEEYGLTHSHVYAIRRGDVWKDLP